MTGRRLWTDEEIAALRATYALGTAAAMVAIPTRVRHAIRQKASELGLSNHPAWTEDEDIALSALWGREAMANLVKRFDRTASAIRRHAELLRLTRHPEGTLSLSEAARRAGYSSTGLRCVLRAKGVRLRRSPAAIRHGQGSPLVLLPELVDAAVAAYVAEEEVRPGIRERGLPCGFAHPFLRSRGHRPPGQMRPWRAPTALLDEAASWYMGAEVLSAGAARAGCSVSTLSWWLRESGAERVGSRPSFVRREDVDAVIERRAKAAWKKTG